MRLFFTNLTSMSWWLSVALVAVALNVLSAYLVRRLDSRLSRTSTWWRKRSERRRARDEALVAKLKSDPHKQIMTGFKTISWFLYFQVAALLSIGFMTLQYVLLLSVKINNSRLERFISIACGIFALVFLILCVRLFLRLRWMLKILQTSESS